MAESGFDSADILMNRGLNGYGYGRGRYANTSGAGNFPGDGSVVNANVEANRDLDMMQAINSVTAQGFQSSASESQHRSLDNSIVRGNEFLTDRIAKQSIDAQFANVTAQFASMERQANAAKADTDRQLHSMELKQVECCCKLTAGQEALSAKLDTQGAVAAAVAAAKTEARLEALIEANGHHHHRGN